MAGLARVWLALAGLVAGVLSAPAPPGVVAAAAFAGGVLAWRRRSRARAAAVVALSFALGTTNAAIRSPVRQPLADLARSVPSCTVAGRTLEEAGGLGVLAAIDRVECDGGGHAEDAGAAFVDDFDVAPGRRFSAEGWLIPLTDEPFDRARLHAGASASLRVTEGTDLGALGGMHGFSGGVRDGLAAAAAPLGAPGALLRGLAIGDTGGVDVRTEELLRRSGLAHLLAVSGSNVAILLGVVAVALRSAPLPARVASCGALLVVFVGVVGPDASVLRAAGMGAVGLVALGSGRRSEPLHALGLALIAVVALRPGIVYSAGLHLSVAATLGIVLWAAPLADRLRLPRPVAVALGATAAAQVAVLPLLAGVFGNVPLAGLPANLLAIPAVAPATILGLAAGAVAPWWEAGAALPARLAAPFAAWVLRVGEAFGEPGWATVSVPREAGVVFALPILAAAARGIVKLSRPPRRLGPDPSAHPREVS